MNQLQKAASEMIWGEPILPIHVDRDWEARVKGEVGQLPDILRRVAASPWIREACFKWPRIPVTQFSEELGDIGALITAQENACRYCYGVARANMRLFGHSDKAINKVERSMQLGEMDERQRVFIRFCRNLARSSPRPPKLERERLISLGYSPQAVAEMAFHICNHCFVNRVATFISCLPMQKLESMPYSLLGKIMRPLIAKKIRGFSTTDFAPLEETHVPFPGVVSALDGLTGASAMNEIIQGAVASDVVSPELRVLIFAVVAKALECPFCQQESKKMATSLGFEDEEFAEALATLRSPRLSHQESKLLNWSRETVHYDAAAIQKQLRELTEEIEPEVILEAIGLASLANSVVRLAILLD